jgi:hypothetical protein
MSGSSGATWQCGVRKSGEVMVSEGAVPMELLLGF